MGLGYYTTEEIHYDKDTGENHSATTWYYKPFLAKDIPVKWNVNLLQNAPNPKGVLSSKGNLLRLFLRWQENHECPDDWFLEKRKEM